MRFPLIVALSVLAGTAHAQGGLYLEDAAPEAAFTIPVAVAAAPDGRLFVAEKWGKVRVIHPDGTVPDEPFVDLAAGLDLAGDRGLIGIALAPDFETSGAVYLLHTVDQDGDPWNAEPTFGRVVRYEAADGNPDRADPASRHVVLGETFADGLPSCLQYHSVGSIVFGSDGTLFVGMGDSASIDAADTGGAGYSECFEAGRLDPAFDIGALRAQALDSPNGKILRVDPETGLGLPSNPFYTGDPADTASKVWAYGLRNPFRFSVIEAGSENPTDGRPGRLAAGDVGWYAAEELDLVDGGENFGWPCVEGPFPRDDYASTERGEVVCGALGEVEAPAAWWHRTDPALSRPAGFVAQSITAGVVYPGETYPEAWRGRLFLGDFSARWIGAMALDGDRVGEVTEVARDLSPVGFAYDPVSDAVVVVDVVGQKVYRIRYAGAGGSAPVARAESDATVGAVPFTVQFSGAASFDPDGGTLEYRWDFGDGAVSSEPEPRHTYTDAGAWVARLTVTDPDGGVATTVVRIRVGRALPDVSIVTPSPGAVYEAGDTVRLVAEASDPFEPADALAIRWSVDLVHNQHVHPSVTAFEGAEADYEFPPHGDGGEVVFYRLRATVTDGEGLERSVIRQARTRPPADTRVEEPGATAGAEVLFDLGGPVRLTRAEVDVDAGAVEVDFREGGVWRPARSLYLVEGDRRPVRHHVLFEHVVADAVRVRGAGLRPEAVRLFRAWQDDRPLLKADLFPNPATDAVSLRLGAGRPGVYRVSVFSVLGREVGEVRRIQLDEPATEQVRIDLRSFAAGAYFVRVVHEESAEVLVRRMVVIP